MSAENTFIASLRALAKAPEARGLEDDAAVINLGNQTLVITHDTIVEGVHVRDTDDPADIAWKLIAVNLSDLAAKGARPLGVLVSHMLGEDDDRFVLGLSEVLAHYDVSLLGGDTVGGAGRRVWGCTAIGSAAHCPVPDRRGARPGDAIFVTGVLGKAMLGFKGVRGFEPAYLRPKPLLDEGIALAPHVSAMMDVSDGLLLDAARMARASGTVFDLQRACIPVAAQSRFEDCIRWGDDYQLLFTAPSNAVFPTAATRIGTVSENGTAPLLLDGSPPDASRPLGYQH
ncbi:thiamine-phosphate kinase [Qipengyuania sp. G39]|uniref:Thiamine-monophosphate kinase n=1 Tax=Qipengyuania profundimaris TaxID=3067652 RepID=A0ABT9HNH5_9SPHN|nr:thiamine-phosphate kinase [Qipengyuania sp. G39]MDP4574719.1 thiamine-phosphate kinase [Qipengyuania sp. G39]